MPEGFEEIGQGDRFGHGGHPRGKEGNRVVDPADQQHEAHQGPGSDIGEVKGVTERGLKGVKSLFLILLQNPLSLGSIEAYLCLRARLEVKGGAELRRMR